MTDDKSIPNANGWYHGDFNPPESGEYEVYYTDYFDEACWDSGMRYIRHVGWKVPSDSCVVRAWRKPRTNEKPEWVE